MAYAVLANLPPQFGLYSSFMGVTLYWIFATSKDICIGVRISSSYKYLELSWLPCTALLLTSFFF